MGVTRLKLFAAPKNFCGFRPVQAKTRLKLAHFYEGEVQQVHEYGKINHNQTSDISKGTQVYGLL